MIKWQKIIKYIAYSFAFSLIVGIVSSIMYGVSSVFSFFDDSSNEEKNMKLIDITDDIRVIDVNIDKVDLKIENDDDFRIEISDEARISYNDDGERLIIDEKEVNLFDNECQLIIYVPSDKVFDSVFLVNAAGIVKIDSISTKRIDLELGMGSVSIDNLSVNSSASIDSGVGEFVINKGIINNLELDMGVGDVSIAAKILGKSEIDSGVGRLELNLVGSKDDYKIEVDKGMGTIKVDGNSLGDESVYGTGSNYIDIDGGVGEIAVKFVD